MRCLFVIFVSNIIFRAFDQVYCRGFIAYDIWIENIRTPLIIAVLGPGIIGWLCYRKKGNIGFWLGAAVGGFNLFVATCRHWFQSDAYTLYSVSGFAGTVILAGITYNCCCGLQKLIVLRKNGGGRR